MTASSSAHTELEPIAPTAQGSEDSFDILTHARTPVETQPAPFGWTPPILTKFPSPSALLASLRRQWFVALCMGLIGTSLVAGIVWKLYPPVYRAEALIQIQTLPPDIISTGPNAVTLQDFSSQQAILLRSPSLLAKVVQRPELQRAMNSLPPEAIRDWILNHLTVEEVGDKATIRLGLSSDSAHELQMVLTVIVEVYLSEQKARADRITRELEALQQRDKALLLSSEEDSIPIPPSASFNPEATKLRAQLSSTRQFIVRTKLELADVERELNDCPPPSRGVQHRMPRPSKEVDEEAVRQLEDELADLQETLDRFERVAAEGLDDPSAEPYKEQKAKLLAKLAKLKADKPQEKISPELVIPEDKHAGRRAFLNNEVVRLENQLAFAQSREETIASKLQALAPTLPVVSTQIQPPVDAAILKAMIEAREAQLLALMTDSKTPYWAKNLGMVVAPSEDAHQKRLSATILGGSCGFLFWSAAVGFIEFRRRRLTSVNEISQGLDIPLLGTVPPLPGKQLAILPSMWENRDNPEANAVCEAIDVLRTLLLRRIGEGPCVVMVTSAQSGEGKTSLACQLALSLSRAWRKTLLVDADLRKPGAHQLFHLAQEPGLSEVLRGEVEVDDIVQSTPTSRLWMVPAGEWDSFAVQSLAQERAVFLFEHFRKQYDFVIVDGGPILSGADALLTAQHCDALVLTAREQTSRLPAVHTAHERLLSLELPSLGCVVVGTHGELGELQGS